MSDIGAPITIQNTDAGHWVIECNDAVTSTVGERVSFTVNVPRSGKNVGAIQKEAFEKAIQMLQVAAQAMP